MWNHRFKGTQEWNFLYTFFAETESLWSQGPVTRDFGKSYSIRPRYSTFKHFRVCSVSDEIISSYVQPAFKSFPRMLSVRWNHFLVCPVCVKIVSAYAQHAQSACHNFQKLLKNPKLKCKFWLQKIQILKNRLRTHLIGPKCTFWKKKFLDIFPTKFGSAYAQSPRKCSNFEILAKIEGKETNFFSKIYQGHIRIWFR